MLTEGMRGGEEEEIEKASRGNCGGRMEREKGDSIRNQNKPNISTTITTATTTTHSTMRVTYQES